MSIIIETICVNLLLQLVSDMLLKCTPMRPNAAIEDCNAALKSNPDSAKVSNSYKITGLMFLSLNTLYVE
jgi:hypothetical protein